MSKPKSAIRSIYVIEGAGLCKIGVSRSVTKRLKTLQANSPVKLELVQTITCMEVYKMEWALHELFAIDHSHGEWFTLDAFDLSFLARLKQVVEKLELSDMPDEDWQEYLEGAYDRFLSD